MIKLEYYRYKDRFYCLLYIKEVFEKKFILPNCKSFFNEKDFLMIEVKNKKNFFLNEKIVLINIVEIKEVHFDNIPLSSEKLSCEFELNNEKYIFKAYVPFWGKVLDKKSWTGFLS